MLGDLRSSLVADDLVQRGDDGGARLGEEAGAFLVGGESVDHLLGHDGRGVREQADRLEQVRGHDRDSDIELEGTVGRRQRHSSVVADDLSGDLNGGLADDRVDLAGHDRRTGLEIGDGDLAETGVRSRTHPAQVVADLHVAVGDGPQLTGGFDESVAVGLRFEVVAGLGDRQSGLLGEDLDHAGGEAVGGVDAGAHSRSTLRDLCHAGQGCLDALDSVPDLCGVAAEFLSERHRGGIHEVGAAGLDDGGEFLGLLLQRGRQGVHGRDEGVDQCLGHGEVDRGGEDVVRGL